MAGLRRQKDTTLMVSTSSPRHDDDDVVVDLINVGFTEVVPMMMMMNISFIEQISISKNSMRMSPCIHKLTLTNRK